MEISMFINPDASDEEMLFVRQLGIRQVFTAVGEKRPSLDSLSGLKERASQNGLDLMRIMSGYLGKCDAIHLALPERDQRIDEFNEFLEILGHIGVGLTTFTWESDGVWSSDTVTTRESPTRSVDLAEMKRHQFTHERRYSHDEVWENFRYFAERVVPVAESADVRLLLHPNDPPTDELGGISCLIRRREDYERAFEPGSNRAVGMEFCCGCWLEGGEEFGNLLDGLKYFIGEGGVGEIHFRNVSSPLPAFTETFLDNGYMDMGKIIDLLTDVGYTGTVTLDHTPVFTEWAGGRQASTAYAVVYMRALQQSAKRRR